MNSNRMIVPSLAQDDQGNLQIHIPKEDFGDFIQGLLAQPRTLRKKKRNSLILITDS